VLVFAGVQLGLERHGWLSTRILAAETDGAASFAHAKQHGHATPLSAIKTIASSLGALAVTPSVLNSQICTDSVVVSDSDAVSACLSFADECRQIVEPACGASLSVVYSDKYSHLIAGMDQVVVIVCGGSAVSLDLLHKWKTEVLLK
jgi:L-serine/L-threonine ammonia-lyase